MKSLFTLLAVLFSTQIYAGESFHLVNLVSQPSACMEKQSLPCSIKSLTRQKIKINSTEIVLLKNAIVRVTDFKNINIEPIVGGLIVNSSKSPVGIKNIMLTKFPSYVVITNNQTEVIDGRDFYSYRLSETTTEKFLLDRDVFIKKLSTFYSDLDSFKKEYKKISPIYNNSFKQDIVLQKQILTRRIASVEEEKKLEADRQKLLLEQQRKNKEIFFKRTFAR